MWRNYTSIITFIIHVLLYSSSTLAVKGKNLCGSRCVDVDPPGRFSCAVQAKWGKCEESWMSTCPCSCARCFEEDDIIVMDDDSLGANNSQLILKVQIISAYPSPVSETSLKKAQDDNSLSLTHKAKNQVGNMSFIMSEQKRSQHTTLEQKLPANASQVIVKNNGTDSVKALPNMQPVEIIPSSAQILNVQKNASSTIKVDKASSSVTPAHSYEARLDEFGLISMGDFVQRAGTRFVVKSRNDPSECETFYFVGANTYYAMYTAADPRLRHEVIEVLDDAVAMGVSVIRVWGFSDGPIQWHSAQRFPGVYDETTLIGMDFLLHEASRRGVRIVIVFANYWQHYGGVDQYNIWSYQAGYGNCNGEYSCRDEFFIDPVATNFYKQHISTLLNRVNTFNGRKYKDDPAIFGYNLMNEPRSTHDLYIATRKSTDTYQIYNITYNDGMTLQTWIEDVVAYVKQIDPVHLLSTGQEGFFGQSSPLYLYANPGAWAGLEGNDFVRNHQVAGIDFSTMHVYVDQWLCDLRGSTREGQMAFFNKWITAHQQAAEEELQMPVILEEFGGKLEDNKRYDLYKAAFESQLSSAQRGGSFGGVMFWVLYHSDYEPMDIKKGGYGMFYPAPSEDEQKVHDLVFAQTRALREINEGSGGSGTCVWYPSWPEGLGCRDIEIDFQLGGMPWECLPGEPENLNWCNGRGRMDLYQNPPDEWKWKADGKDLPYNSIEALIMGRINNISNKTINLNGSYIIIPFSRGIHTVYEGVWERIEDPNMRFNVFCWYATIYEYDGITLEGESLCKKGAISFEFTKIDWPIGVKQDRGLKIKFHGDVTINPGGYIAGNKFGNSVLFSFKGNQELLKGRLDVSSMTLAGATECASGPRLRTWPPPPPPSPPLCSEGKHPHRGCPQLEWYTRGKPVNFLEVTPTPQPCEFQDCPDNTYNPYQQKLVALPNKQPTATNNVTKTTQKDKSIQVDNAKALEIKINTQDESSRNITGSSTSQDKNQGRKLLQENEFDVSSFVSTSNKYAGDDIGMASGKLFAVSAVITASGSYRGAIGVFQSSKDESVDLSAAASGLLIREAEPDQVDKEDIGPTVGDTPNPEERGAANRGGLTAFIVAEMKIKAVNGKQYRVIGKGVVIPNGPSERVRGVIKLPEDMQDLQVYAQVSVSGLSVSMANVSTRHPLDVKPPETDQYNPCIIHPDHSPDAIMLFTAEQTEEWTVVICSRSYGQTLRLYEDGEYVTQIGHGFGIWKISDFGVKKGSHYYFVLDGSDHGFPYGSWSGGSGIQIKRNNGKPFEAYFDAKPRKDRDFIYAENGKFWKGCQQFSYVGVNTWDLMDIARWEHRLDEVDERLDELKKIGLTVGRTWGFSLGTGTTEEERKNRLQLSPGVYDEAVFRGLDYALFAAAERGIRLIISIEDFWLSIGAYEDWSDTMQGKTDFYTDWQARNFYKDHLKQIVRRKNTYTNVTYMNDPTIFAWNLINEPRCTGCGWALQGWIDEMSLHLKALDPNHMITVGQEGFYSQSCHRVHINPGAGTRRSGLGSSPWALQEGQDFIRNHRSDAIDFATVHIWMDNWMGHADYCGFINQNRRFDYTYDCALWKEKLEYTKRWLSAHIQDAKKMNKPLIVQEFGKTIDAKKLHHGLQGALLAGESTHAGLELRDIFFAEIYKLIEEDALNGGNTLGSNFWNLYREGHGEDDPYHVTLSHKSTMDVVNDHAWNMKQVTTSTKCR